MTNKPANARAVMASRREPPDSLEFFPTPPFATRALCENILRPTGDLSRMKACDPAAGEGHIALTLTEYFGDVARSDIFDYGKGDTIAAYVVYKAGLIDDVLAPLTDVDWVITNPPFSLAQAFCHRALGEARRGLAMIMRTPWLEGVDRFHEVFSQWPPSTVAVFCERVAMVKGRWDHEASTATAYSWFVWDKFAPEPGTKLVWIPPGQKERRTKPIDFLRFMPQTAADLFEE